MSGQNPFPGLRPFEPGETHLFFGREGQSATLLGLLREQRFVAVIGPSGSGKSSLVRAGLVPALIGGFMRSAGSRWRIAVMRPGSNPLGNLGRVLAGPDALGTDAEVDPAYMEATLRRGPLGLLEATEQARLPDGENLLLVVDQFEEIFRFQRVFENRSFQEDAAAFVKLLMAPARQTELPVFVLITMRSDFIGECGQFRDLPELVTRGQYLIPQMTRAERRLAITGPVAVAGGTISERLVNRLLNEAGDDPNELPILQHSLMRMWGAWEKDHGPDEPVDLRHYEAIGELEGALSKHADEAFFELPSDRHRDIAERVFRRLTERGPDNREIRRPTRFGELCSIAGAAAEDVRIVLDTFRRPGRSFLLPSSREIEDPTLIDISHESLIRGWDRLRGWVEEEVSSARVYRRLAETAVLHEAGEAALWRDPDLQFALDWWERDEPNAAWASSYSPHFDEARHFLEASREARDERRAARRRRTRRAFAALGIGLLLTTGLAGWALVAQREAARQAARAEAARDTSMQTSVRLQSALQEAEASREAEAAAAAEASRNLGFAVSTADRLAADLLEEFPRDMRIPSAAVLDVLEITEETLGELGSSDEQRQRQARLQAVAAEILLRVGRTGEAMESARHALALTDGWGDSEPSAGVRLTRARAYQTLGAARASRGAGAAARADLDRAARLATPRPGGEIDLALARVWVKAKERLARIEDSDLDAAAAREELREVEGLADRLLATGAPPEAYEWKISALSGRALALVFEDDEEAARLFGEAQTLAQELREREPDNLRLTELLAALDYMRGFAELQLGRLETAEAHLSRSLKLNWSLTRHDPDNLEWQRQLSRALRTEGELRARRDDWEGAEEAYREALAVETRLLAAEPEQIAPGQQKAALLLLLGDLAVARASAVETGNLGGVAGLDIAALREEARAYFEESLSLGRELRRRSDALVLARDESLILARLSSLHRASGRHDLALAYADTALQAIEQVAGTSPHNLDTRDILRNDTYRKALYLPRPDSSARAEELYRRSLVLSRELMAERSARRDALYVSWALFWLGDLAMRDGRLDEALDYFLASTAAAYDARQRFGPDTEIRQWEAWGHRYATRIHRRRKNYAEAVDALQKAVDLTVEALRDDYGSTDLHEYIGRLRVVADSLHGEVISAEWGAGDRGAAVHARADAIFARADSASADPRAYLDVDGQGAWSLPPLMTGEWRALPKEAEADELDRLSASVDALRFRRLDVRFYDGADLFEVEVARDGGGRGVLSYLRNEDRLVVLDGTSDRIHSLNRDAPLRIRTTEDATAYLRLFVGALEAEEGRFKIIDDPSWLNWREDVAETERRALADSIVPLRLEKSPSGAGWQAVGTVAYRNVLFLAIFRLYPNGAVTMVADIPLTENLEVDTERFGGDGVRAVSRMVDALVYELLQREGIEVALERHRALIEARPDSVVFWEGALNSLGYRLLREERVEEAIAVFEMNVEAYPQVPNVYDSLGDGLRAAGRLEEAVPAYRRAVQLAEDAGDPNLPTFRANLESATQELEEGVDGP